MKVLFIQTGGTIDKDYPKRHQGYAFEMGEPAAQRVLDKAGPGFDFEIIPLLRKDSLELTSGDRKMIRDCCLNSHYSRIIITHGSDTLVETARTIGTIPGKTIVLTGAYRPERFTNSDADFNLGVAVGAVNVLTEGTFIAMNGEVMDPSDCYKNPRTGYFEKG